MCQLDETQRPHSPLTVIEEFSKTVVTVSSALLGITVTFSSHLIGKVDEIASYILFGAWGLSVLAIALAIVTQMLVIRYLSIGEKRARKWCALCGNAAFFVLILAATAFAVFGIQVVTKSPTQDAMYIAELAIKEMPRIYDNLNSQWIIQTLIYDSNKYELTVQEINSGIKYFIILTENGVINKIEKI